ncbi:MAG: hypothetical protein FWC89_13190 [Defluviitaleaceae bacterium]|nr:hypothetical protein [Defluviitaleaceae bacterium]
MRLADDNSLEWLEEARHLAAVQAPAVEAYNVIMNVFFNEFYGVFVHPDNYAGAYVDYDTLVILLTDISDESKAFYTNLLGYNAPITFKQVDFSLNQLVSFGEMFVHVIDVPVLSHGFCTMDNVYRIAVYQNCTESIQLASRFNDSRTFLPVPISIDLCSPAVGNSLVGGSQITRGTVSFSVGLTGVLRDTTTPALITAGHAFQGPPVSTAISSNGQQIGTLQWGIQVLQMVIGQL